MFTVHRQTLAQIKYFSHMKLDIIYTVDAGYKNTDWDHKIGVCLSAAHISDVD